MARTKLKLLAGEYRPEWSGSDGGSPVSPIFLAFVAAFVASGAALWTGFGNARAGVFIFVLAGWLISLCLHEYSHAVAAYYGGDHTVRNKGYLRLDPLKYGHPLLTFGFPIFYLLIGGLPLPGGAVMIESHRLRNRFRDSLVSIAGPAVNIVSAAVLLTVLSVAGPDGIYSLSEPHAPFWAALTFLAYLQVATAILNLLPIPGLDGYGIIEPYLSYEWRRIGNQIRPYGLLIMFALLFATPQTRTLISDWSNSVIGWGHVPVNGYYWGYSLFKFWHTSGI